MSSPKGRDDLLRIEERARARFQEQIYGIESRQRQHEADLARDRVQYNEATTDFDRDRIQRRMTATDTIMAINQANIQHYERLIQESWQQTAVIRGGDAVPGTIGGVEPGSRLDGTIRNPPPPKPRGYTEPEGPEDPEQPGRSDVPPNENKYWNDRGIRAAGQSWLSYAWERFKGFFNK